LHNAECHVITFIRTVNIVIDAIIFCNLHNVKISINLLLSAINYGLRCRCRST